MCVINVYNIPCVYKTLKLYLKSLVTLARLLNELISPLLWKFKTSDVIQYHHTVVQMDENLLSHKYTVKLI